MSVLGSVKVTGEWIHVLQKLAQYHKNGQLVTIGEHYLVVFGGGRNSLLAGLSVQYDYSILKMVIIETVLLYVYVIDMICTSLVVATQMDRVDSHHNH
jgi:hypothetical protein